ncbi:hypothetical protein PIB30_108328, partial [Stylosanthes scabra]|nr:hypothetical protein [Stylosanthes scabra]
ELLDYVIPARIVSKFLDHKFLFVVDSRPIGYDLNKSLHIVRGLSDDSMLINFFEGDESKSLQFATIRQVYQIK